MDVKDQRQHILMQVEYHLAHFIESIYTLRRRTFDYLNVDNITTFQQRQNTLI